MIQFALRTLYILIALPLLVTFAVWAILASRPAQTETPEIRKFPYPYKAALTIASDIDSTDTVQEFLEIQEFLNTQSQTPLGQGLGLELGASFFPTARDDRFAFISSNPHDRRVITDLNRLGYMDFVHSFGHITSRDEVLKVAEEMKAAGIRVDVWVNHSDVKSDLGPLSYALGDDVSSDHYHTDKSVGMLGIRFVWVREVSSIIGQDRPLEFMDFFSPIDSQHVLSSFINITMKEISKFALSPVWQKYRQRWNNDLIYPSVLDDGTPVFVLTRAEHSHRGIGLDDTAAGLAETIRPEVIGELIANGGTMIVYTHYGVNAGPPYLPPQTVSALRYLAEVNQAGKVFVTTTSRLLNYVVNRDFLDYERIVDRGRVEIRINRISDGVRESFIPTSEELQGITFYVDDPARTTVTVGGSPVVDVVRNPPDETGRASISIPWRKLEPLEPLLQEYRRSGVY